MPRPFRSATSITNRRASTSSLDAAGARLEQRLAATEPLSPVHSVALDVLTDMIDLGVKMASGSTGGPEEVPLQLRVLMRTLAESRPLLERNIAKLPPRVIREFMADLVARMQLIVDAPDSGGTSGSSTSSAQATG